MIRCWGTHEFDNKFIFQSINGIKKLPFNWFIWNGLYLYMICKVKRKNFHCWLTCNFSNALHQTDLILICILLHYGISRIVCLTKWNYILWLYLKWLRYNWKFCFNWGLKRKTLDMLFLIIFSLRCLGRSLNLILGFVH